MANKKYKLTDGNMWATDGIHDFGQNKTQRTINSEVNSALGGKAPTNHASTATTYGAASTSNYGHVKLSNTTPSMDGTAAVGDSTDVARANHVHPSDTSRVPTTRKINGMDLSQDRTLTSENIGYNSSTTYSSGTVGKAVSDLNGAITPHKISNVDLDTITTQGLYICSGGITNSPNNINYGYLTVFADSANCKQEFTYYTSMRKYYRIKFNGVWTAWSEIVLADSAQLTGIPTAPTAPVGTNTTQLATTQFVQNESTNRIYYKLLANGASINLPVTAGHCYLIYAVRVATLGQTYGCWLIDSWGGVVTINNINNVTVTYADNVATITNNSGGYINVPIFDLYEA